MGKVDFANTLYDTAMSMSRAAFAGRHYAVAYHALAAALHAAFDLGDDSRLAEVGQLAGEQDAQLARRDPAHELSAPSAAARGARSLWATLAEDAQRRRGILGQQRRLMQTSGRGEGASGGEPTPRGA